MNRRRTVLAAAGVCAAMFMLAGCGGGDLTMQGHELKHPDNALTKAEKHWRASVRSATDEGTATISKDSHCYFREVKDDEVGNQLYCGPIRRLGKPTDHAWDAVPVALSVTKDGDASVREKATEYQRGLAVDTDKLIRPDGDDPVSASSLDKPKAPRSDVADFAAMVPADQLDLTTKFKAVDDKPGLITPSATVKVAATADLSVLPRSVVELASESPSKGGASYFRPAEGQHVKAWRVTIGPGPQKPDANLSDDSGWGYGDDDDVRDASTSFAIGAGGQRLVVHGQSPDSDDSSYGDDSDDSFSISCESLPCSGSGTKQYILIASTSSDTPDLVATVDGANQALRLPDGEVTSDVSTIEYSGRRTTQQVSTTWPTRKVKVSFGEYDDETLKYGGQVDTVYLTGFDVRSGWAPKDKAWLEVPTQDDPADQIYGDWNLNSKSLKLKTDGKTYTADKNAGADGTVAFLVPEDFTKGTFIYRPTGSVEGLDDDGDRVTKPFTAKTPLKLQISIPKGSQ